MRESPKMFHFIMPPDGLEDWQVDDLFRSQANALQLRGHQVSLVDDSMFRRSQPIPRIPVGATVVYRGWMVRLDEYAILESSVIESGAKLLTNLQSYGHAHHLPNWYPLLAEFTAETVVILNAEDLIPTMKSLGWGGYFLKDFVKSLKVAGGSIVRSIVDAELWLEKMIEYRDELEGGICLRRIEPLIPESERRYFVLNGVPHSPDGCDIPQVISIAAVRVDSPFFSVDIVDTTDGRCRIIEVGDGQVSDLVGWSVERFADLWSRC